MKPRLFQIELLGGPADGLRVAADNVPGRTIRLPSSPSSCGGDGSRRRRSHGTHLAVYDLARGEYTIDSDGVPIVHVSYEFVGNRSIRSASPIRRAAAGLLRAPGLPWLTRLIGGWGKWLSAWMLAPIDYPMKTRDRGSPASGQPTEDS